MKKLLTEDWHEDFTEISKGKGVDGKDLKIVYTLYWNQKAAVRVGTDQSDWLNIRRGETQGCVLSLYTVR